jgi:hypothetical protein
MTRSPPRHGGKRGWWSGGPPASGVAEKRDWGPHALTGKGRFTDPAGGL